MRKSIGFAVSLAMACGVCALTAQGTDFDLAVTNNAYMHDAVWLPTDGSSTEKVVATSSGDPANPNVYRQKGYRLNTPSSSSSSYTFPDRLESNGDIVFRYSSANRGVTMNDMRVVGNTSVMNWSTLVQPYLAGNIIVNSGKKLTFSAGNGKNDSSGEARIRQFRVTATISGPGALALNSSKPTGSNFPPEPTFIYGDNSGLTGGVTIGDGYGRFCVTNENALGSGAITLNGGTLLTQKDVSFTAPNRSVTLSKSYNWVPTFEVADGTVNYFAWPIHGTAKLVKGGGGTLVLAAPCDYTGGTLVTNGTMMVLRRSYIDATKLTVCDGANVVLGAIPEGVFLDVDKDGFEEQTLSVLGTGGFNVDLDGVTGGNATALIRVTEAMTHEPFAVTVFNVTNAPAADATPIKLLSAPSLADFKDVDFFVDPPYAGKLSRTSEGGEDVLWFTPTPKANIIFKTAPDRQGSENYYVERNDFWDNGQVATAGNVYVSTNVWIQSTSAFPAPLVAYGTAQLMPRSANSYFPDLTLLDGVSLYSWTLNATLSGHVHLAPITHGNVSYAARVFHPPEDSKHLYFACEFDGYGTFEWVTPNATYTTETFVTFTGKNTNFFGKVNIHTESNYDRVLRYRITSEEALGGNPPAFRADQLRIYNAGYLCVANDVTLDDPNRGITVGKEPNSSNNTVGNLMVTNGATLTVACPITGNSLNLKGQGTFVLANPTNSHAGGTSLYGNVTLVPRGAKCLGSGLLYVYSGCTMAIPWPHDMPNGVEIGGGGNKRLTFYDGSKLTVAFADGYEMTTTTTIPLLYVPDGATGNATQQEAAQRYSSVTNFPFDCKVAGFTPELKLEGRLLSVTFRPSGMTVILR